MNAVVWNGSTLRKVGAGGGCCGVQAAHRVGYGLELRPAGALGGGWTDARGIDDGGIRVCGSEGNDRVGVDLARARAQAAVSRNRREANAGGGRASGDYFALGRVGGDRVWDCDGGGLAVALDVWGQYCAD